MRTFLGIGFLVIGLFAVGEGILVGVYGIRSFWTSAPVALPKTAGEFTVLSAVLGALIFAGGVGFLYLGGKALFGKTTK